MQTWSALLIVLVLNLLSASSALFKIWQACIKALWCAFLVLADLSAFPPVDAQLLGYLDVCTSAQRSNTSKLFSIREEWKRV